MCLKANHLESHNIFKPGTAQAEQAKSRKHSRPADDPELVTTGQIRMLRELLAKWIVESNVPFNCVEHETFQALLDFMNPALVRAAIPHSHNTVKKYILERFEKYKQ